MQVPWSSIFLLEYRTEEKGYRDFEMGQQVLCFWQGTRFLDSKLLAILDGDHDESVYKVNYGTLVKSIPKWWSLYGFSKLNKLPYMVHRINAESINLYHKFMTSYVAFIILFVTFYGFNLIIIQILFMGCIFKRCGV